MNEPLREASAADAPPDAILDADVQALAGSRPEVLRFLEDYGIRLGPQAGVSLRRRLAELPEELFEDIGIDRRRLEANLGFFLAARVSDARGAADGARAQVRSITVVGGRDKSGNAEDVRLELPVGSVTGIVGPTGSGKSRLLADIEWMAQGDTPTGRVVLVNGEPPDLRSRFSPGRKLVAQLSQNMNFVMDASAGEFVRMHAESRRSAATSRDTAGGASERLVADVIAKANLLAGEAFAADAPLTSLSGGQSRALMIADTAFLSASPIVLIDEIENAGIDRKQALDLLVRREKIVLMATHDPILALMADQRLVICGGGIQAVLRTSEAEKKALVELERIDRQLQSLRERLRRGESIGDAPSQASRA
ncbi:MAG: ATP-binding cassette domain-containing protein [Acidobacteriota bacterium]|jgi:ABC-type lipoprotein export system ATPase subunit|nr:ATP-binding cassette domain-containing protein [Acidobacteriota bacterium]